MHFEIDYKTCGKRLREVRDYLGFSRKEVVTYLGFSCSTLSNIERGQRRVSDLELKQLAVLYKQPVSYFTGESEFPSELPEDIARLAAGLSEQDWHELSRFVGYLRARWKVEGSSDGLAQKPLSPRGRGVGVRGKNP